MIGTGVTGGLVVTGLLLVAFRVPRFNRVHQPAVKTAIYWGMALLIIQGGMMLAATNS
jgi:hypothetical protein